MLYDIDVKRYEGTISEYVSISLSREDTYTDLKNVCIQNPNTNIWYSEAPFSIGVNGEPRYIMNINIVSNNLLPICSFWKPAQIKYE